MSGPYPSSQLQLESDYKIPCQLSSYPSPSPPIQHVELIYYPENNDKIDAAAIQIPLSKACDFPTLVHLVTELLVGDVQKVRALFTWLGHQDILNTTYPDIVDPHSPYAYVQQLQEDVSLYSDFFALLCRQANIPCVVLRGLIKDAEYESGDIEQNPGSWNAVYVGGGWRHVNCERAFVSVVDRNRGRWLIVERDGYRVREEFVKGEGQLQHNIPPIDEYFFMSPDKFVWLCLPDEKQWQLLSAPVSESRFNDAPCNTPQFVKSGFSFRKGQSGQYKSVKGECVVVFKAYESWKGSLKYDLVYKRNVYQRFPHGMDSDRFVAVINKNDKHEIHIHLRLPIEGKYRLRIYEEISGTRTKICEFRITCEERCEPFIPFPAPRPIGWGPSNESYKAGLCKFSHRGGILERHPKGPLEISFKTKGKQKITARLERCIDPEGSQRKGLSLLVRNAHVQIKLSLEDVCYALVINSRWEDGNSRNVLNYIIVSHIYKEKTTRLKQLQNVTGRIIQQSPRAAITTEKTDLGLPSDTPRDEDEVQELKHSIRSAISKRRERDLALAISKAKSSRYRGRVSQELVQAQKVMSSLPQLPSSPRKAVTPRDMADLRAMRVLSPPALNVLTAVYMLLGENRDNLKNPNSIQCLMKQSGSEALLSRMVNFDPDRVHPETVEDARRLLDQHEEHRLTKVSRSLGKIYVEGRHLVEKCSQRSSSL